MKHMHCTSGAYLKGRHLHLKSLCFDKGQKCPSFGFLHSSLLYERWDGTNRKLYSFGVCLIWVWRTVQTVVSQIYEWCENDILCHRVYAPTYQQQHPNIKLITRYMVYLHARMCYCSNHSYILHIYTSLLSRYSHKAFCDRKHINRWLSVSYWA